MNRRGFIAALIAAPLVPSAIAEIRFDGMPIVWDPDPANSLAAAMDKCWRECIGKEPPAYILCGDAYYRAMQSGVSGNVEPFWGRA